MHDEDPPLGIDDLRHLVGELRMIARQLLQSESPHQTLCPTALAMTALRRAKLVSVDWDNVRWENRAHFFSALTRAMRHALVDHARHRKARGRDKIVYLPPDGDLFKDLVGDAVERPERFIQLDDALSRLAAVDAGLADALHQFYFLGYSIEEMARIAGCSERTVKRDLTLARCRVREFFEQSPAP